MMHLAVPPQKDVPNNMDACDAMGELPCRFWPSETLWANMEGIMPEDFNLGSIPPVELGHPGQEESLQAEISPKRLRRVVQSPLA